MTRTQNKPLDAAELASKLAQVYADAVVAFLESGIAQGIDYDPDTLGYVYGELDEGTAPTDVGLWVADRWQDLVGELGMPVDPRHREYSAGALRAAIVASLSNAPPFRKVAMSIAADRIAAEMQTLDDGQVQRLH